MTQSLPPIVAKPSRRTSAPSPEHRWISHGSTLNPSPGPLLKQRQDTAEGCRDRATADLLQAVTIVTANGRQMLERSAASWNARAELLQLGEIDLESRRNSPELTPTEIAEDAAYVRLSGEAVKSAPCPLSKEIQ